VQRRLNHADRCITGLGYNQDYYAKEIEIALEMLAGKVREGLAADPAQGVVVLAGYKEEKMAAATNG
jgi:hypothetical protein